MRVGPMSGKGMTLIATFLSACCRTAAPAGGTGTDPEAFGALRAADGPQAAAAVPPPADPEEVVTCPVCGLEFPAGEARAAVPHGGRTHRFLLEDHADAFRRDPARYLAPDGGGGP